MYYDFSPPLKFRICKSASFIDLWWCPDCLPSWKLL